MRRPISTLSILLFMLISETGMAQLDPLYAHYHFNQYMINPAYAGLYNSMIFSLNTRAQWFGLEGAPVTNTFTLGTSIGDQLGGGLIIINDRIGIKTSTEVSGSMSYFIKSDFLQIGMGLQAGINHLNQGLDRVDPEALSDPVFDDFVPNSTRPNFGLGFVVKRFDYYLGFSVPRILKTREETGLSDSLRYERHYYFSGGVRFTAFRSYDSKFQSLIRIRNGRLSMDLSGTYFFTDDLWGGILIRDFSSITFFGQLQVKEKLRFGYSFELPTTNLITTSFGTHELMISYTITPLKNQRFEDRFF